MTPPLHSDGFVPGQRFVLQGAPSGPLAGLGFAVKDLIDIAARPTGAGTLDWAATRPLPAQHAPVVARLLEAGAHCLGKTVTCELSLGALGFNGHFGTPPNPRAPGCFPGGSSSGSASVVAAGLSDFALGTDSGCSVRVPASFCGLYGLRPTHGRIAFAGTVVQAPSFDTIGWLAREGDIFARVGEVLLGTPLPPLAPAGLYRALDAFGLCDPGLTESLAPAIARLETLLGTPAQETNIAPPGMLAEWGHWRSLLQRSEALESFSGWVTAHNPRLQFNVARSLAAGPVLPPAERPKAEAIRAEAMARAEALLGDGSFLCLPATPFTAPHLTTDLAILDGLSARIGLLTSFAGLAGLPQLVLPATGPGGKPLGLSLIGARGSDERLVAIARAWDKTPEEETRP